MGEACHGIELPFVFHNIYPFYNYTQEEDLLSKSMITYWTNFAKTENPNTPNTPPLQWPFYSINTRQSMKLDWPLSIESGFNKEFCDFWDVVGYNHGT